MSWSISPYFWALWISMRRKKVATEALALGILIALIVVVVGNLWKATIGGGTVAGYSAAMMVWYIAIAESCVVSGNERLMSDIEEELKSGIISIELLRPVSLFWNRIAREVGEALPRLPIVLLCTSTVAVALVGTPPSGISAILLSLPFVVAALILQTVLLGAAAASNFWIGESGATWFVVQKLIFFGGGMLLPLDFWPDSVASVLKVLPFAGIAYTPAHAATFGFDGESIRLITLQFAWIFILGALGTLAFARGQRRLVVHGG